MLYYLLTCFNFFKACIVKANVTVDRKNISKYYTHNLKKMFTNSMLLQHKTQRLKYFNEL